jgi:hypothetical protein
MQGKTHALRRPPCWYRREKQLPSSIFLWYVREKQPREATPAPGEAMQRYQEQWGGAAFFFVFFS